jgi:CDP-glucose 4,6-dehydratase
MSDPADAVWHGRNVLVTGGTGVVGGWVVRALLDAGATVIVLVRDTDYRVEFFRSGAFRQVSLVPGQIEDYPTLERAINHYEVDTVIHLAAQAIVSAAERSPLETFEANIRGTYNVLEACRVHSALVKRLAVASSDKAYGDNHGKPYQEDQPLIARHPYDVSKTCGDLLAQTYAYTYDLPVTIARCGNIYGGGDLNWSRLVPGTIRSLYFDQSPQIRSDGSYVRDYLYVKDAAAAYLALAEHAADEGVRGEAFNFSAEAPLSVLELVASIARLMDRGHLQPKILNQAKHEIPNQVLSSEKARRRLRWQPRYTLETGLRETIGWYTRYLDGASAGE